MVGKIITKIKKFFYDKKGSMLPMIAIIIILLVMIGCVNLSLTIMYRNRATVRNALDVAIVSSLASASQEKTRPVNYGEYSNCTAGYWVSSTCTDSEGNDYDCSYYVCTEITYFNSENDFKNYIWLNKTLAKDVANQYLIENLDLNKINYRLLNMEYDVKYDQERYYTVRKNRNINRPSTGGIPAIVNTVTNPDSWWINEFNYPESAWSSQTNETKRIIFPRWVEVTASVTVELPIPFGNIINKPTFITTWEMSTVKELDRVLY